MSIGEAFDSYLEDTICPVCHHQGMDPDGDLNFICPNCDWQGSMEDDEPDEDD